MENAAGALKIIFGIFIFVIAFSTCLMMLTQAKDTADVVTHHSDQTNWYEYTKAPSENIQVTKSEVISNLYRIYGENIDITINIDSNSFRFNSAGYYKNDEQKEKFKSNKEFTNIISNFIAGKTSEFSSTGNNLNDNYTFEVSCKEIKTSGIYEYGNDGTEIVKTQGGTKLYITYTKV